MKIQDDEFEVDASGGDQVEISPRSRRDVLSREMMRAGGPMSTPRSRQISAFLSSQAKSISEERNKKTRTTTRDLRTPSWMKSDRQWNHTQGRLVHELSPWRQAFEIIMDQMNKEIWQYERRTVLADVQSIVLLSVSSLFLLRTCT